MGIFNIKKNMEDYARSNFTGVMHTTLNPDGPGVVRIHLIPPEFKDGEPVPSVAIINGQDIIPVNLSWAILLNEFIGHVNKYHGHALTEEDIKLVMQQTERSVRKVFPLLDRRLINKDLLTMVTSFAAVAHGKLPEEAIGYMSLGEYAPYMKAPHRMDLMVSAMTIDGSWHCNQKCMHCYAADQPQAEEKELSGSDWESIIDKCREIGIPQLTFTGGEPTLRKDLVQLIDHSRWFVTRLNTNGVLLSPQYCKELYDASLDSMQITFYSDKQPVHNMLVGSEHFKDTVCGMENAMKAGLNISINTPLCTLNKDYISTLKYLHSLGIEYVTCSGLIATGNASPDKSEPLQLGIPEIKRILTAAAEYCYANNMEISFTSPGWVNSAFCEKIGLRMPGCGAALSNMAVTPGGNVVPCQSWLTGKPLGNMLTDSWEAIWNSPECVKHREYSAKMEGFCPLRKGDF